MWKSEISTWNFHVYVEIGNLYVEIPRVHVEKKALLNSVLDMILDQDPDLSITDYDGGWTTHG